jgi:hypothetical protein
LFYLRRKLMMTLGNKDFSHSAPSLFDFPSRPHQSFFARIDANASTD